MKTDEFIRKLRELQKIAKKMDLGFYVHEPIGIQGDIVVEFDSALYKEIFTKVRVSASFDLEKVSE